MKMRFEKCIYCDNYTKGGCKENQCTHLMERAPFGQMKYGIFPKHTCMGLILTDMHCFKWQKP